MPPRTTAPGSTDQPLRPVEHERPLMDACREANGGRLRHPGDAEHGGERDRRRAPERAARAAELTAVLRVGEVREREPGVAQDLAEEPGGAEQRQCSGKRRPEADPDRERHRSDELERPERHCQPARLVREQSVVDGRVQGKADGEHEPDQLDRPPLSEHQRVGGSADDDEGRGREPRLDAAPQRVRHDTLANRRAAHFIPTIVSAAG